jgi:hypothetical protein
MSQNNQTLVVDLDFDQVLELQIFGDRLREAAAEGKPGMLLAQVFINDISGQMKVGFLDYEHSKLLSRKDKDGNPITTTSPYMDSDMEEGGEVKG